MKKINVLRPRDENAMLISGSDGQNYQSGGGAFVGQGGAPIV